MAEITVEADEAGGLTGGEGIEFRLQGVVFDGNQVFTQEELMDQINEWVGIVMEVTELQKLADNITAFYHSKGYLLTRAYLPPQTIAEGRIVIAITEGRLGRVIVRGNQRYKAVMIKKVMQVVKEKGALTGQTLERGLLLLNDYPGMSAKATLVRGREPGTTDVVVQVLERKWWQVGLDYNNFGSEFVSQHRVGINFNALNMTGIGDNLALRWMFGLNQEDKDGPMWYLRADYSLPVYYKGTRLGLSLSRLQYDAGQELVVLDYEGQSDLISLWASHPFKRSRNFSWWLNGGLDIKRIRTKMFGLERLGYEEDLTNMRVGAHFEWLDGWKARNIFTVNATRGLGDEKVTSRLNAVGDFTKFDAAIRRFQSLPYKLTGLISLAGQASDDRLPTNEMASVGGAGTIRGYGQGDYSGDSCLYGTLELRYPLYNKGMNWNAPSGEKGDFALDFAVFTDAGKVWVKDNLLAELGDARMWSAGLGLRGAWAPYGEAKIEWAKSVSGDKPLDKDVEDNGYLYLQLSLVY